MRRTADRPCLPLPRRRYTGESACRKHQQRKAANQAVVGAARAAAGQPLCLSFLGRTTAPKASSWVHAVLRPHPGASWSVLPIGGRSDWAPLLANLKGC
ncbi:hypothetical protein BS78_07G006900 [Paspalum vaginatum]|nr:hypothetical protein BS78_07G006900 [Paspalum vaginatum]